MSKLNLLHGEWMTEDEDSRVVLRIDVDGEHVTVAACDPVDGEQFVISGVAWDGASLSYKMLVPSSGYKTTSVLTPVSETEFRHQITFEEVWHKTGWKAPSGD